MPHRIFLRGPWEYEPLARAVMDSTGKIVWSTDLLPAAGRAQFPATWQSFLGEFRGRVRFRRRFHRPTNLDPDERVFLAFEGVRGHGSVRVNGHVLGTVTTDNRPQSWDVTPHLTGDDALEVDFEFVVPADESAAGGLYAPVALEIWRAAESAGPNSSRHRS